MTSKFKKIIYVNFSTEKELKKFSEKLAAISNHYFNSISDAIKYFLEDFYMPQLDIKLSKNGSKIIKELLNWFEKEKELLWVKCDYDYNHLSEFDQGYFIGIDNAIDKVKKLRK